MKHLYCKQAGFTLLELLIAATKQLACHGWALLGLEAKPRAQTLVPSTKEVPVVPWTTSRIGFSSNRMLG